MLLPHPLLVQIYPMFWNRSERVSLFVSFLREKLCWSGDRRLKDPFVLITQHSDPSLTMAQPLLASINEQGELISALSRLFINFWRDFWVVSLTFNMESSSHPLAWQLEMMTTILSYVSWDIVDKTLHSQLLSSLLWFSDGWWWWWDEVTPGRLLAWKPHLD